MFDLVVDNPSGKAIFFGYNIFDFLVSLFYCIVSIFLLWTNDIDFWVYILNVACLVQAWIHTTLKSRAFSMEILNNLSNKDNERFAKGTCKGYARKATLEIVTIACDIVLLLVLRFNSTNSICTMRIAISVTMALTCVDNLLSGFENMYEAKPARLNFKGEN